jgi:hypothetical protein
VGDSIGGGAPPSTRGGLQEIFFYTTTLHVTRTGSMHPPHARDGMLHSSRTLPARRNGPPCTWNTSIRWFHPSVPIEGCCAGPKLLTKNISLDLELSGTFPVSCCHFGQRQTVYKRETTVMDSQLTTSPQTTTPHPNSPHYTNPNTNTQPTNQNQPIPILPTTYQHSTANTSTNTPTSRQQRTAPAATCQPPPLLQRRV